MPQKIIQVGNSTGVIIPKSILKTAGLELDTPVEITKDPINDSIIISRVGSPQSNTSVTSRTIELLDQVNQDYGQALKQLADK